MEDNKILEEDNIVHASPTKRFFVEMLTRDIETHDAILDLLDNCVDGILRKLDGKEIGDLPYKGFFAKIKFDENGFSIEDNCGGIPEKIAKEYAFMMGRRDDERDKDLKTVGMYGIGMKRAMFKLGRHCEVISYTDDKAFKVVIGKEWMKNDKLWDLELEEVANDHKPGTIIFVTDLTAGIKKMFAPGATLFASLPAMIGQYYSYIIKKGFQVTVNNDTIQAKEISMLVSKDGKLKRNELSPYIYQGTFDEVNVYLIVGFYRPMAHDEEVDDGTKIRRTSEEAGWTVICNDRVVLYNDKTILTGWGDAGVPSYHPQFIGISGLVFFESKVAGKLPLTTTKRGIDGTSVIYLRAKNYMREGMKKFTDYTNHWKGYKEQEREYATQITSLDALTLAKQARDDSWQKVRGSEHEFKLNLPLRKPVNIDTDPTQQIKFFKRKSEIAKIQKEYLSERENVSASDVGAYCFEQILNNI